MTTKFNALYESKNWMLRQDYDGTAYRGFRWAPLGEWTEALDWDPNPVCGGGLHGQFHDAKGCSGFGTRLVLCEIGGERIAIDNNKIKVRRAKIVALNQEIESRFLEGMALNLKEYNFALPSSLTHTGDLYRLDGYKFPLPAGLTYIGNIAGLAGYKFPLPVGLTHAGNLYWLDGYKFPLPVGLTHAGDLYGLAGYRFPLPVGFVHAEYLYGLAGYRFPLPVGLTYIRNIDRFTS